MYRVITYRSNPLKSKTIFVMDEEAAEESAAIIDVKKRRKNKEEELTYVIDGVRVREEDLTDDERQDIRAEMLLNADGFYTPLQPIDVEIESEEKNETKKEKKTADGKTVGIIAVLGGAAIMIAGIIAAMVFLL